MTIADNIPLQRAMHQMVLDTTNRPILRKDILKPGKDEGYESENEEDSNDETSEEEDLIPEESEEELVKIDDKKNN